MFFPDGVPSLLGPAREGRSLGGPVPFPAFGGQVGEGSWHPRACPEGRGGPTAAPPSWPPTTSISVWVLAVSQSGSCHLCLAPPCPPCEDLREEIISWNFPRALQGSLDTPIVQMGETEAQE